MLEQYINQKFHSTRIFILAKIFLCGSVTKPISLYQFMFIARTLCSGDLKHQMKFFTEISKHGIIGPFWLRNDKGEAVTVNTERYILVLQTFWTALSARRAVQQDEQWFQQDGATPHIIISTLAWLERRFVGRLISQRRVPDFRIHRILKYNVYRNNPQTIEELETAITQHIRRIKKRRVCKGN